MGGLTLNIEITLNNWINSLNTTSSLDIRVAPATRTRGEGGRRPPSPLVDTIHALRLTTIMSRMGSKRCNTEAPPPPPIFILDRTLA